MLLQHPATQNVLLLSASSRSYVCKFEAGCAGQVYPLWSYAKIPARNLCYGKGDGLTNFIHVAPRLDHLFTHSREFQVARDHLLPCLPNSAAVPRTKTLVSPHLRQTTWTRQIPTRFRHRSNRCFANRWDGHGLHFVRVTEKRKRAEKKTTRQESRDGSFSLHSRANQTESSRCRWRSATKSDTGEMEGWLGFLTVIAGSSQHPLREEWPVGECVAVV